MCSITNTAHARSPPATRTEEARGAGQRSRMDCDVYLLSCSLVFMLSCSLVFMLSCSLVFMLSCLYVVGRHSLGTTVLKQKGACNQGGKVWNFFCGGVTRRHSFGKCVLTTLLKKVHSKKNPVKQQGFFHKPNQGCRQA